MATQIKSNTKCFHCGDSLQDSSLVHDQKKFCCDGCSMVYQIIKANGLGNYYRLEQSPGITPGKKVAYFDFLDDEIIQQRLLQYKDGKQAVMNFDIPAIHCSSCIWLLENIPRMDEGVFHAEVNFPEKKLHLKFSPLITSLRKIAELLSKLGYDPAINLENMEGKKEKAKNTVENMLLTRLGVAGFCFGNIMLLAFPEYLDSSGQLEQVLKDWFGWISIGLSLPVVFFSAADYWRSAWKSLQHRYLNLDVPIVLGIMALFGYSVFEIITKSGMGYLDSLGALLFLMLSGKYFQQRTYKALSFDRDYKSFFPVAVLKLENGIEESKLVAQLEVGDEIILRHGEILPVDGYLHSNTANLDYSFITGESEAVPVAKGEFIYAGGKVAGNKLRIKVAKKLSDSELLSLWNSAGCHREEMYTDLKRISTKVSRYFTPILLLIAFSSLAYWSIIDLSIAVKAFSTVLIIACPCALALSVPFTYGHVMRVLARNKFFIKNTDVLEDLQVVTDIVFDKTGTLTAASRAEVNYNGVTLTDDEVELVKAATSNSLHAVSKGINRYFTNGKAAATLDEFSEHVGEGIKASAGGNTVAVGKLSYVNSVFGFPVQSNEPEMKGSYIGIDGQLKGFFSFHNKYRQGLEHLVEELKGHYHLHVLSGDSPHEKLFLQKLFGEDVMMLFRQNPRNKKQYIEKLREKGSKVMMVGDGLNDAGALLASDFGVSVTDDTSLFTPAADAILTGSELHRLPDIIRYSKTAKKVVYICFIISFVYNVIGLSFAVQGLLSPLMAAVIMPLSTVTVVSFTTFATRYLAGKKGL